MAELAAPGTFIDLHTHTTYSDGELGVAGLLDRAVSYGLGAISITDHDTVAAYTTEGDLLRHYEDKFGLTIVPGIEISTAGERGQSYHILGLNIDPSAAPLQALLARAQQNRNNYTSTVYAMLRDAGWQLNSASSGPGGATITKAHVARDLLSYPGNAKLVRQYTGTFHPSEGQLIEATLNENKPFYVPKPNAITSQTAIDTIHLAGGVAILAHPAFNIMNGEDIDRLTAKFFDWGIDGFEGIYVQYDRSNGHATHEYRSALGKFCARHGLLLTGGSDFHTDDETKMGPSIDLGFHNHDWKVPYTLLEQITGYRHASVDILT